MASPMVQVNVRLQPALAEAVAERALREDVSVSDVIRDALRKHLGLKGGSQ